MQVYAVYVPLGQVDVVSPLAAVVSDVWIQLLEQ